MSIEIYEKNFIKIEIFRGFMMDIQNPGHISNDRRLVIT
jgi:hypothetical protein